MKRLMIALPLLLLAADKPEIDGWKVVQGKWEPRGMGMFSDGGSLEWSSDVGKQVRVQFRVVIHKWIEGTAENRNRVGVFWCVGLADQPRYHLFITKGNMLFFMAIPTNALPAQRVSFPVALGKPIRVKMSISTDGITARIGKKKWTIRAPSKSLGKLWLHCDGAEATFSQVSVKTK